MIHHYLLFPQGKHRAVTFSYDDGVRADLRLAETLDRHGMKGTFNLCSGLMTDPDPNRLTKEEIRTHLLDKGHEIAVHGAFHRAPGVVRTVEGIRDVLDCRLGLETMFDTIIQGMAYPNSGITRLTEGVSYETIRTYLQDLGIIYSRTLGGDNNSFALPTDWYAWMPTAHHDNPKIMEYIDQFLQLEFSGSYLPRYSSRLFYIWGHSYEFDQKNNWDHLEEICGKLSGNEDIWYATNGEICNYVKAYHALVFSVDASRIYNPTLQTVWLNADGAVIVIHPGETVKI